MAKLEETIRTAKPVLAGLIAVAVLVVIFQNQEPVRTRLLLWQVETPRFLLLAIVYGLGVATRWVVFWRARREPE